LPFKCPSLPDACSSGLNVVDPDLAAVLAAWPSLPEAIKAGILAMVRAASK
jgi:hypothetical protein